MTEGSFYITVSLPPERCFPHLEEMDTSCQERLKIVEKAMISQLSADFLGREDCTNTYAFYHPILVEVPDEVFYAAYRFAEIAA